MKEGLRFLYLNMRKSLLRLSRVVARDGHPRAPDLGMVRKILFVRIDRIGDLVLSTPAIRALKAAMPNASITVLASPENSPVLEHNPRVEAVVVFDRRRGLSEILRVIRVLRTARFDLAVDPYDDYEILPALLAFASCARWRGGYGAWGREAFFNLPAEMEKGEKPFAARVLDVLKPIGISAGDERPEIFLSTGEQMWATEWLAAKGLAGRPVIGLHPGAFYESQRWPAPSFAELASKIPSRKERDVLLFGGPGDADLIAEIRDRAPAGLAVFAGNDLRKFCALLSCCSLLVCNNSGPLHLATALGVPTVSFMGPTLKEKWSPTGKEHVVMRVDDLPCIGCNRGICKTRGHECMQLITPASVLNVIEGMRPGEAPDGRAQG